jgi:hypothetical protein
VSFVYVLVLRNSSWPIPTAKDHIWKIRSGSDMPSVLTMFAISPRKDSGRIVRQSRTKRPVDDPPQ